LYSFYRDNFANGYLLYFKKECFSFFKPVFENEFAFFNLLHTNFFKLNQTKFDHFAPHFEEVFTAYAQQILFQKFINLINNYYIDKRTIEEYAELLFVTPNHLSQSVKDASKRNTLSFINERIMSEAKSLIPFTEFDVAEIAHQLNFSDPANFGKYFKKHAYKAAQIVT
jgi:AraC family transcriptional activator of pobA